MDVTTPGSPAAEIRGRGRMPLFLPGWDDYSVWGWDDMGEYLYAQLWKNIDDSRNQPRVWITPAGRWPVTTSPEVLADQIASATGCPLADVLAAMASSAPPALKTHLTSMAA